MEILYKCGCCGYVYNSEEGAVSCESRHESWRNATVEFDKDNLSQDSCGSPRKIRLRNDRGISYTYIRVSDYDDDDD